MSLPFGKITARKPPGSDTSSKTKTNKLAAASVATIRRIRRSMAGTSVRSGPDRSGRTNLSIQFIVAYMPTVNVPSGRVLSVAASVANLVFGVPGFS